MKVKVVSTKPLSIQDKPDIKGVELVFEHEGQTKTLSSWIPPVVSQAANWKAGDEVEIEQYEKDGRARFKTPQAPSGGRGGGGGRAFTPDPLRYACDAATSIAQTAWRIPDGATEYRTGPTAQGAADHMLAFVEKAIPRILQAMNGSAGPSAQIQPADQAKPPSPARAEPEVEKPPPSPVQESPSGPDGCEHDWRQKPQGWVKCVKCGEAEQRELADA